MNLPRSVEMGRRPRCSATRGPSPDVEAANKTRKKKCVISSDHRSISVAHLQEGIELGPCPFRRLIQQPDRLRRSRRRGAFRLSPEAACQLGRFSPREKRLRSTKNVNVSLGEMREVRHVRELVSPKTPMHVTLRVAHCDECSCPSLKGRERSDQRNMSSRLVHVAQVSRPL